MNNCFKAMRDLTFFGYPGTKFFFGYPGTKIFFSAIRERNFFSAIRERNFFSTIRVFGSVTCKPYAEDNVKRLIQEYEIKRDSD